MCVFAKLPQVCSPQAERGVQILPDRNLWLIALIFLPESGEINICQGRVWNMPWLGPACNSFLWYFYFKMWCKQPGELNLLKSLRQTTSDHTASCRYETGTSKTCQDSAWKWISAVSVQCEAEGNPYLWLWRFQGFLVEAQALGQHSPVVLVADILIRVVQPPWAWPRRRPRECRGWVLGCCYSPGINEIMLRSQNHSLRQRLGCLSPPWILQSLPFACLTVLETRKKTF